MKYGTLALSALAVFTGLTGHHARADNMASIAIAPSTGVVTLVPRWAIGGNLAGFHFMSQNTGFSVGANNFYSIKDTAIPMGGDISAFTYYIAASGAATDHQDVGSKLTPNSYSALTSADPDIGYGAVNFYLIHHKGTTDYFADIVPGSGTASSVADLKPMSGPGGPATVTGVSGYFGLTFAAANLGYGLNMFYYFRTDPVTGFTKFGTLAPGLLSGSTDQFDLGMTGHTSLIFTGTDVGYGTNKMYFLRLDPITGFTILGTLNALTGKAADIANLGSVYSNVDFVPGDVGFAAARFYVTGTVNPTWQSVSFAAIPDRAYFAGSFTVSPSASSALPIVLTVVTGSATISAPVAGVFTVTPNAAGLITLQASQAGQSGVYEPNMLRQSFRVTGGVPDFNADGKADIIWTNTSTGERAMWLMNGGTIAEGASLGTVPTAWKFSSTGDFDGNGKADVVLSNTATGDRAMWLMNGSTIVANLYLGNVGVEWTISAVGDFNGDGNADLFWTNTVTGDRTVWLMNGGTLIGGDYVGNVPVKWKVSGKGDFNGDGKWDIVWTDTVTGERAMWLMNGATVSAGASLGTVPVAWTFRGVGDFDGDGKTDLMLTNTSTGDRALWLMNGPTIVSNLYLGNVDVAWTVGAVADYNGDGMTDIFWSNTSTGDRSMWLMNGGVMIGGFFLGTVPVEWVNTP